MSSLTCCRVKGFYVDPFLLLRSAKLRIRAAQECSEVASECPGVALELVRDIFECFDLFF